MAEIAAANEISDEPAFNWWVKETLRHRDRIISKVKSKYWYTPHNFEMRVPKAVKEACEIDRQLGTDFWTKAVSKDMTNVRISFVKLGRVTLDDIMKDKINPGYEHVNVHMIFDINMGRKFTTNETLVAYGHTTSPPSYTTYSSVVSRESVGVTFLLASLNELYILACDIGNAYLNAKFIEKLCT